MATFMESFRENLRRQRAARARKSQGRGLVMERPPQERVGRDHTFYGNGEEAQRRAMSQAKKKIMAEGLIRQAYDKNKKAIRVTCIDEF